MTDRLRRFLAWGAEKVTRGPSQFHFSAPLTAPKLVECKPEKLIESVDRLTADILTEAKDIASRKPRKWPLKGVPTEAYSFIWYNYTNERLEYTIAISRPEKMILCELEEIFVRVIKKNDLYHPSYTTSKDSHTVIRMMIGPYRKSKTHRS